MVSDTFATHLPQTRMNSRFTVVETSLNRAEFRWKWVRFLRQSLTLGMVLCFLALLLEVAMLLGWVAGKPAASVFFVLLAVLGVIAWFVIIVAVLASAPDRNWLAGALERVDRRLLDRLNTLLFLERHRGDSRREAFAMRIARQTQGLVAEKPSPSPFSRIRTRWHFLGLAAMIGAMVWVYRSFSPWERMLAAEYARVRQTAHVEKPQELALPPDSTVEQDKAWGEVRITDPGGDMKVTKVDVVPLQIEAAANHALKQVGWFSTVNGAGETSHELPPPAEPRYAVYQPTVYLDELRLSDWDVMTYYAKASAEKDNSYASEIYFLEVRPFREDILKMPGGEGGKAYQCLNEMTALIGRQQHVIRQTHQTVQKPQTREELQTQDRKKLSDAEGDLSASALHLYAKMAGEMENKPISEALDNLAKAEQSLDHASDSLAANSMPEAQGQERTALTDLVNARKIFQKAVSDHPEAFEEPKEPEPPPDATQHLNQMAEFRNEAKAAQDFVHKTIEQQKGLERQAGGLSRATYPKLAGQERELEQALEEFEQQHPQGFKGVQADALKAQEAMTQAAESLDKRRSDARAATQKATQQLEQFSDAMRNQSLEHQLADAYRLKQMLDQQIKTLNQSAKPESEVSEEAVRKAANEARETVSQLKKVAEQEPTRDAFGDPLRDALSGDRKVDLDVKLNRLDRPRRLEDVQDGATRQERAAEAGKALADVSKAFEQSQPGALRMAQRGDSLKPDSQNSFSQGMTELDSLVKQLENNRPVSQEDLEKQGHEAMLNLQDAMRSRFGNNDRADHILISLDKILKAQAIDLGDLRKLMEELQHFSVEVSDRQVKKDDQPEVTNIDPTRLPPAYRGRIQKYFQKLSEK